MNFDLREKEYMKFLNFNFVSYLAYSVTGGQTKIEGALNETLKVWNVFKSCEEIQFLNLWIIIINSN